MQNLGGKQCIMGNWKIENYCCFLYLFLLLQWPILQLQIETRLNANFSLDLLVGILVKFVEFKPVGFKACLRRFGKQQFINLFPQSSRCLLITHVTFYNKLLTKSSQSPVLWINFTTLH